MSKGSPIVGVRLSPLILAAVNDAVANYRETRKSGPMTLSRWIQEAIASKLAHAARSKRASVKKVLRNRKV